MPGRRDPLRIALQVGVYVFLYIATALLLGPLLGWIGDYLVGITMTGLLAATFSNGLAMRIYERLRLIDIGLAWDKGSVSNLMLGLIGGIGAASLVLCGPLLVGSAHLRFPACCVSLTCWRRPIPRWQGSRYPR